MHGAGECGDAFRINGVVQPGAGFEGTADDETIGERNKIADIFETNAAAKENFYVGASNAHALDICKIGGESCSSTRHDKRISETAFDGIGR